MLITIPETEHETNAIEKVLPNVPISFLNKVYRQGQINTGGIALMLTLKQHARVVLTANLGVLNGRIGTIQQIKRNTNSEIVAIYLKWMITLLTKTNSSDNQGRKHNCIPIKKIENEIKLSKIRLSLLKIKKTAIPSYLIMGFYCTQSTRKNLALT